MGDGHVDSRLSGLSPIPVITMPYKAIAWHSPTSRLPYRPDLRSQIRQPFAAYFVHDAPEFLNLFAEPSQFFFSDPVVLAVACLDVGLFEFLKQCPLLAIVCRPDIGQAAIEAFGLSA